MKASKVRSVFITFRGQLIPIRRGLYRFGTSAKKSTVYKKVSSKARNSKK